MYPMDIRTLVYLEMEKTRAESFYMLYMVPHCSDASGDGIRTPGGTYRVHRGVERARGTRIDYQFKVKSEISSRFDGLTSIML